MLLGFHKVQRLTIDKVSNWKIKSQTFAKQREANFSESIHTESRQKPNMVTRTTLAWQGLYALPALDPHLSQVIESRIPASKDRFKYVAYPSGLIEVTLKTGHFLASWHSHSCP